MRKLYFLLTVLLIACFGCKKDKKIPPGGGGAGSVSIQLMQGNNQRDTIGNMLKDSIIVKVTNDGTPAGNYIVRFKRSGCEDIIVSEKTTNNKGEASYPWYLSAETGGQLLTAVLMDNNRNVLDSILVNATGIPASHGWHRSGCVQNFPVNTVAKLNSGRLICALNAYQLLFYSDDNAVSWKPLRTFPNNYFVTKIIAISSNEVFMATMDDGMFYSNDNGQTWQQRINGIGDPTEYADMTYTRSGKLIYTNQSGVYISTDKGQNWEEDDFGLPAGPSSYPCETSAGTLYVIGSDNELYKSVNNGGTWINLAGSNTILASIESLFIDSNDDMYIGNPHNGPGSDGTIYKSTDGGSNWNQVFIQSGVDGTYPNITQISKLGGSYYFSFAGRGVYQTTNFSSYTNNTARFAGYGLLSYAISQNSSFLLGSPGYGVFYYVP